MHDCFPFKNAAEGGSLFIFNFYDYPETTLTGEFTWRTTSPLCSKEYSPFED